MNSQNWKQRFFELWNEKATWISCEEFIDQELSTQRQQIIEMAEEMKHYKNGKPEPRGDYQCDCGYDFNDCCCEGNQTLEDLIAKIKEESHD